MAVTGRIAEIQQQFQRFAPPVGVNAAGAHPAFGQFLERSGQALAGGRTYSVQAPAELERYGNGRIPESALVSLGSGGQRLWGPAAEAFRAMSSAAAEAGVRLDVTDSYRSFTEQVDVARRKGLYRNGGLAAAPGTSTHGWGLSVDVSTAGASLGWLRRYGAQFGFVEDVAREPWHWTYTGR